MAEFFAKEIILGLTVQEFLLHLLNFLILVIALRLLLYKPVKKFMQKRKEEYRTAEEKYQNSLVASEESVKNSELLMENARDEAVRIAEEAHALAMVQTQEIIAGAREEAEEILKKAESEAAEATKQARENLYYEVSALAVNISEKLIGRELNGQDNDVFIDNLLNGMKKQENGADNA